MFIQSVRQTKMTQEDRPVPTSISDRLKPAWVGVAACGRRRWLHCLILILLGVSCRLPALQGPFLWDDLYLVRDNPFIRSPFLSLEAFRHYLFPDSFAGHYRPLQTVSYIIDYFAWATDAYGYHLFNLIWHIASGLLLYLLLQQLLGTVASSWSKPQEDKPEGNWSGAAFFITLLWIVHPVHSAAIDYISGRADSLAFFFACAGWLFYLQARNHTRAVIRWTCYSAAALAGLASLCSRESGFVWMAIFLLYVLVLDQKVTWKSKLTVLGCCLAVAACYGALRAMPEYRPGHDVRPTQTLAIKGTLMMRALGDYGRLMVWPANLHMERDVVDGNSMRDTTHWRQSISSEYLSIGGIFLAAMLVFGALRKGTYRPVRILGAGWFLLTYLPISNIVSLNATVAEHWLYLPSVGFLILVVGFYLELPRFAAKVALPVGSMLVLCLCARSFLRSGDWAAEETFYKSNLLAGGTSPRMCVNLAVIYSERGETAKAEKLLQKVLQADPDYVVAKNNLASLLSRSGRKQEAEQMFVSASKATPEQRATYPGTWAAALNLAHAAHDQGDDNHALEIIDKARCDYPETWALLRFQAELRRRTLGPAAALPQVQEFVKDNWWHCEASIALGRLFSELGRVDEANETWRRASRLDVYDVEALNLMVQMNVRLGRLDDAIKIQRQALSRRPDELRQHLILTEILTKLGRHAEARMVLTKVANLKAAAVPPPLP